MLLALGVQCAVTDLMLGRRGDDGRNFLSAAAALQRIDSQSVLFFLGILLAIGALETHGSLAAVAEALDRWLGRTDLTTLVIGLASSVVDNVPLVAAVQGMYPLEKFPMDHDFWLFLAYCAGTGGSILIIGSAAGVAVMGIQRVSFNWYVRHYSLPALLGYGAGAATWVALSGRFLAP
jgi:Na+/H+ antiporter NhaD/arsenite permease-like protein